LKRLNQVKPILTIVVHDLTKLQSPLAIVLDDYHQITNPEIDEMLSFLLEHSPEGVHIIVASRTSPALPLAKLRARAQLLEITEEELRFTREEVIHFLQDVMGLELSTNDYSALEERTEGWVAGLQLAALSLENKKDATEFIATLSGTHRHILDYLAEEVFIELPEVLQIFLLRISPLMRFSGELCDAVVGDLLQRDWKFSSPRPGKNSELTSQAILAFLDDSNLFVFPLDHERKWFRFHPLFSEFLQDRLTRHSPDELPKIHQRAADWFSKQGFIVEAINHAVSAGNVDQSTDLIADQIKPLLVRGETSRLIRWIEEIPPETLSKKPIIELGLLWSLLLSDPIGFRHRIIDHLVRLKESLGVDESTVHVRLAESEAGSQDRRALSEFALLVAFLSRDQGDNEQTIALFEAAMNSMPEDDHFTQSFGLAGLASTYGRVGKLQMAEKAFAEAAEHGRKSGSAYAFVASKDWEATMQALQGRLNQASVTYHTAISYLSEQGVEGLPLTGHAYVGLAEILLEKNNLDVALSNVEEGIQRGGQVNDLDALREGHLIRARILAALGEVDKYQVAIEDGIEVARQIPGLSCLQEAQAWKAILQISHGAISNAANWAAVRGLEVPVNLDVVEATQEIERKAFSRLLLAQRKYNEAEVVLESLLKWSEENELMRSKVEILAHLSLALHAAGKRENAVQKLSQALILAEPEGFVRTFIESGPTMAALLRSAAAVGHSPEYVKQLLKAYGEDVFPETPIEPLTERELDVLRLMATGSTNAEIATELVVAQSTVKTHINRIYSKLGVTQRTKAVAKAREMGLIQ
jgi:LuxR family maltose regulon positive regulatory protein